MLNQSRPKKKSQTDIKDELQGRTHEVLMVLGVNPIAMSTQIPCPLAIHHEGRPSFMVNPQKNRYYCTECTPRGASLIDLVIGLGMANNFNEAARYLRFKLMRDQYLAEYLKRFETTENFED